MAFMNNQRFPYCEDKEEWFMYKEQRKNPKFFRDVTAKQVNIVGSESLLGRLHSNLEQGKVEPFFYKETLDLYEWRLDFFNKNLPHGSWTAEEEKEDSDSDSEYEDFEYAMPDTKTFKCMRNYQITSNFRMLVFIASSMKRHNSIVFLTADEDIFSSYNSKRFKFDKNAIKKEDKNAIKKEFNFINHVSFECLHRESGLNHAPFSTDEGKLSYTDVSHLIEATFRCGPPSLLHLCLKQVLLHGVSLEQCPKVVQDMSGGLYDRNTQPKNITEEGKDVIKRLAAAYDKHFDDEEEEEEETEGGEEEETEGEETSDEDSEDSETMLFFDN